MKPNFVEKMILLILIGLLVYLIIGSEPKAANITVCVNDTCVLYENAEYRITDHGLEITESDGSITIYNETYTYIIE